MSFPPLAGTTDLYSTGQAYLLASQNTWNPRPVFQSYSAYIPTLIEKNKAHLQSKNAPDNTLFKLETIDNRLPMLDDGSSWPVLLSHYQPVDMFSENYLYLKKRVDIEPPVEISIATSTVRFGETISMPSKNTPIFAKINIQINLLGEIINLLFKPRPLMITLNLQDGSTQEFRLISGMTRSGVLLSPLVENTKDFSNRYFNQQRLPDHKKVKSLVINEQHGALYWKPSYEIAFSSLRLPALDEIPRYYQGESLSLIKNTEISSNHAVCEGVVDIYSSITPTSQHTLFEARGWLTKSVNSGLVPKRIKGIFVSTNGMYYWVDAKQHQRNDVGAYFNNPELSKSGYSIKANTTELTGQYYFKLGYEEAGKIYVCPQFNIPIRPTAQVPH